MEVQEMNRVIAEFMGLRYFPKCKTLDYSERHGEYELEFDDVWTEGQDLIDGIYSYKYNSDLDEDIKSHYTLKYDTSWDWLMPVVIKIKDYYVEQGRIHGYPANPELQKHIDNLKFSLTVTFNIQELHIYVYKFIVWYNQQKH
jgi:hypothetical protein